MNSEIPPMLSETHTARARSAMVENQIAGRGVRDSYVLEAMRAVPREKFIPSDVDDMAYEDKPLPVGHGQTISQPYIVALMAELAALHPRDKVLEIGTGSGYGAAVLSEIAGHVYTVERYETLAMRADNILTDLGYDNVTVAHRNGTRGWPEKAPFDAIVVTAGATAVPDALKYQLAPGGRLVVPVESDGGNQTLLLIRRTGTDDFETSAHGAVSFVPLVADKDGVLP